MKLTLKTVFNFPLSIISLLMLFACDSGNIYPVEKQIDKVTTSISADFTFDNIEAFPKNYRIGWGAFVGTSPYPLSVETAVNPTSGIWRTKTLTSVPRGTTFMALALLDKTENRAVYIFQKYPLATDTVRITETVNLSRFERVQAQIFNAQCIVCHGESSRAAGLDLTEGNAYANLVNVPGKSAGTSKNRVTPRSIQNSFLYDVLTVRPSIVSVNHTTLSTLDSDDTDLIRMWIMAITE